MRIVHPDAPDGLERLKRVFRLSYLVSPRCCRCRTQETLEPVPAPAFTSSLLAEDGITLKASAVPSGERRRSSTAIQAPKLTGRAHNGIGRS